MEYTVVNGKKLSKITLGTVQLGMNYGIANNMGKPDSEKSHALLTCALENGITSLDTARAYGTSEQVLGDYFEKNPQKERPFITSKIKSIGLPPDASDKEVEANMYHSVEASMESLGVKKLDCLLLHFANDMTTYGEIVPRTLEDMVKKGYCDLAGASVYLPGEVETMLQHDVYQAIQVPMSLFDQPLIHRGYIDRLKAKNILVFVRSVFLQGIFFMDPEKLGDPLLEEFAAPHLKKLREFCRRTGMTIAELAISFIRDIPGVTSLVLGADTEAQVLENIRYLQAPKLSPALREEMKEAFKTVNLEQIMVVLRRPKEQ